MTQFGVPANQDNAEVNTTAEYGDDGSGANRWHQWTRQADGGDVAFGAKADAAEEDPTVAASALARLAAIAGALRSADEALMKAEDTEAFSGDAGVMALAVRRDTPGTGVGADNDYTALAVDSNGYLLVKDPAYVDPGIPTIANDTSAALEETAVVKATAGTLFGIQGHVTAACYVWICDKSTAPNGTSDGLKIPIYVDAAGPFSIGFGPYGRPFTNGISLGVSTGSTTWTGAGSVMWVDAQYE